MALSVLIERSNVQLDAQNDFSSFSLMSTGISAVKFLFLVLSVRSLILEVEWKIIKDLVIIDQLLVPVGKPIAEWTIQLTGKLVPILKLNALMEVVSSCVCE